MPSAVGVPIAEKLCPVRHAVQWLGPLRAPTPTSGIWRQCPPDRLAVRIRQRLSEADGDRQEFGQSTARRSWCRKPIPQRGAHDVPLHHDRPGPGYRGRPPPRVPDRDRPAPPADWAPSTGLTSPPMSLPVERRCDHASQDQCLVPPSNRRHLAASYLRSLRQRNR